MDRKRVFDLDHCMRITASQERTQEQKQQDVYEAHRHRVFSVSFYMTANELHAEQIMTDAFIGAFAREAEPDGHSVDQALLRELEERFPLHAGEDTAVASGEELTRRQVLRTDLEEALGALPPRERLIFLLHDVEGYAPPRIAALLGCDAAEVSRTLFSARIRMRNAVAATQRQSRTPAETACDGMAASA